nr:hypothetical protein [uncultured Undibacterium sp.]
MKQTNDKFTRDAFDTPRRGRPRKADAKTPAQRSKEYRARVKAQKFNFLQNHE